MKLEFDIRDGTYHYATRMSEGCTFYSQDFDTKEDAIAAQQAGELVNQVCNE